MITFLNVTTTYWWADYSSSTHQVTP